MDLNYVLPVQPQISVTQEMLPETVKLLKSPFTGATVYVVGTAHVSETSAREVRTVSTRGPLQQLDLIDCDTRSCSSSNPTQ